MIISIRESNLNFCKCTTKICTLLIESSKLRCKMCCKGFPYRVPIIQNTHFRRKGNSFTFVLRESTIHKRKSFFRSAKEEEEEKKFAFETIGSEAHF